MAEQILPAPVKVTVIAIKKFLSLKFKRLAPGTVAFGKESWYARPELGQWDVLWYCCPCGCGDHGCLPIGKNFKPDREKIGRATWQWDGNKEMPTLNPSINHIGHWHGWLKAGYFQQ